MGSQDAFETVTVQDYPKNGPVKLPESAFYMTEGRVESFLEPIVLVFQNI